MTDTLEKVVETEQTNFMGHASFTLADPIHRLRVAAASCFFGEPQYYRESSKHTESRINSAVTSAQLSHFMDILAGKVEMAPITGETPSIYMERLIDEALDHDVEATLQLASDLRNEDNIRTTPQVILVRAANHKNAKGNGIIRKYAKDIILRADEPAVQLSYQLDKFGKTIPNSLKKAWRDCLENTSEFHLAKYRMESRKVKTVDVVRFAHANSPAIDKLVNDDLKLAQGDTWESLISAEGSNTATWTKAVDKMGHMALLRNLVNLNKNSVPEDIYLDKLVDGVATGRQLPFRYWSAFKRLEQESAPYTVIGAVEKCLEKAVVNLPKLEGRVMSLCDNSGSAHGTFTSNVGSVRVSEIANLTAALTAKTADEGHVGVFGDKLETFEVKGNQTVLGSAKKANTLGQAIGQGTETGIWLFWEDALKKKEHWDHVFVYSDLQAGHSQLYASSGVPAEFQAGSRGYRSSQYIDVAKLIAKYRETVNPDVQVYLVQVAGYSDTIVPEVYDKTYMLGGWSDSILRYANKMSKLAK